MNQAVTHTKSNVVVACLEWWISFAKHWTYSMKEYIDIDYQSGLDKKEQEKNIENIKGIFFDHFSKIKVIVEPGLFS